jgi:hypothetical protein
MFKKLLKKYFSTSENRPIFLNQNNNKENLIDPKIYSELKLPSNENSTNEQNEINYSVDLLKEVEIRVLQYINEYSDDKIFGIEEIDLEMPLQKIGKFLL